MFSAFKILTLFLVLVLLEEKCGGRRGMKTTCDAHLGHRGLLKACMAKIMSTMLINY